MIFTAIMVDNGKMIGANPSKPNPKSNLNPDRYWKQTDLLGRLFLSTHASHTQAFVDRLKSALHKITPTSIFSNTYTGWNNRQHTTMRSRAADDLDETNQSSSCLCWRLWHFEFGRTPAWRLNMNTNMNVVEHFTIWISHFLILKQMHEDKMWNND